MQFKGKLCVFNFAELTEICEKNMHTKISTLKVDIP